MEARIGGGMSVSDLQGAPRSTSEQGTEPESKLPRGSVTRKTLVSASGVVLMQGAAMVIGFATAVVLARRLETVGYGRYVFALAWTSVLAIPAILGLDRFLVRGIAVYEVGGEWGLMKGLLRRTNQLVMATALAIAATGCVVANVWLSPELRWPFCVAMLFIPLNTLTVIRQGAMQAIGRVVSGQLPEYVIRPALTLVGIGILAALGHHALGATSALGANIVGVAVAFVVGAALLRRALPPVLNSVRPEYATRDWVRAALPMMLISGVWMANNYCTTLVVGTIDGPRAVGVYSVVQKGAELIVVLLVAANMPLAPLVARAYARADLAELEHVTERVAQAAFVVSLPIGVGLALFPMTYLGIFGSGFQVGATALVTLALAQLVNAVAGPAGNVLLMTGHERAAVKGVALGLVANLLLAVALVPPFGVTGGAIAFATSLVLWNAALVVIARRSVGVNVTAIRALSLRR